MPVEPRARYRISLAGDDPRRPVIGVPVSFVVDRYDVQVDIVALMRLQLAAETHPQRWEHPPARISQPSSVHRSQKNLYIMCPQK